jgi:hypothetical protein
LKKVKSIVLNHEFNTGLRMLLMNAQEFSECLSAQNLIINVDTIKGTILKKKTIKYNFSSYTDEHNPQE